ncbi:splicing factor 3B subunit 2 [Anabrus simplex]|uniref:splicing factor 3B subunit 2 n=1 Tax=Anabrus simplex TaxID=316456 RepID=UPI0034DD925A
MEDNQENKEMSDPQLQQRIQQQQLMIEQQRQEELLRLQQTALVEKQREEQERQMMQQRQEEELYRLQQEALMEKQREDDMMRQRMSGPPPGMSGGVMPPGIDMTAPPPGSAMAPPPQLRMPPPSMSVPPPPGLEPLSIGGGINQQVIGPPGVDPEEDARMDRKLPSLLTLKVDPPVEVKEVIKLPVALEQALAFKTERAKQVGVQPDQIDDIETASIPEAPPAPIISRDSMYDDDDEEEDQKPAPPPPVIRKQQKQQPRRTEKSTQPVEEKKSKKKRKNKRKKKARHTQPEPAKKTDEKKEKDESSEKEEKEPEVEIEYVQETLGLNELEPMYRQFARIFETFRISEPEKVDEANKEQLPKEPVKEIDLKKVPKLDDDPEEEEDEEGKKEEEKTKLSKRKLKKLTRLSVAELKQLVNRPDVVEMHDVTARDPKLLVQLKAHRNTVPVPRHWCFKRKYLQGKRGIEKPPFDLPEFIKKTGIMEMRAALQEKEDQRTLKAKMRERTRPKLGKIDIDYQKLHDAFFKWQTKPRMSIHGDLYYEGKEFETRLKEKKPGDLSEELRTALGMPVGPNAHKVPPPWLIAMQRYGPPPSYPNLKIPGLNAPIPDGCSFGYHAGGWGKPPVDETGRPLYGDVFGIQGQDFQNVPEEEEVDRTTWGELESESEEESEDEDEEEEEGEKEDETGLVTPAEGLITPSGITSIPAGMETPEIIELRKRKIESEMEGNETPMLYQVLPEKRVDRVGNAMMASTHIYDMTGAGAPPPGVAPPRRGPEGPGTVELALDPSELDLVDTDAMAVRYEQQIREQQSQLQKEDLSDMLADHVARQKNKRKQRQQHQDNKQAKKYKEFKF